MAKILTSRNSLQNSLEIMYNTRVQGRIVSESTDKSLTKSALESAG